MLFPFGLYVAGINELIQGFAFMAEALFFLCHRKLNPFLDKHQG